MLLPTHSFDWRDFWADLLKGAGTGLLVYDGSRAAQAAQAGLKVFNEAQQRRRGDDPAGSADGHEPEEAGEESVPWPELSAAERAAFFRLDPAERSAFLQELADVPDDAPAGPPRPRVSPGRRPASLDPFNGWPMARVLPFGPDGQVNIPAFRR